MSSGFSVLPAACMPLRAFLHAALCAAHCPRWHSGEQYRAVWQPVHYCTASSCSDGPLKFWHLRDDRAGVSLSTERSDIVASASAERQWDQMQLHHDMNVTSAITIPPADGSKASGSDRSMSCLIN